MFSIKLKYIINETPLYIAIQNKNVKIVNLLLADDRVDINFLNIFKSRILVQFRIKNFNTI